MKPFDPSWVDSVALILATWRLTSILQREDIAHPIRKFIGYNPSEVPDSFISHLFSCFWCLSVWVSGLCIGLYLLFAPIVYVFAFSAGAILLDTILED